MQRVLMMLLASAVLLGAGSAGASATDQRVGGSVLWTSQYGSPFGLADYPVGVVTSPDGSAVYVTGRGGEVNYFAFATVRYDATTGEPTWVARYKGPAYGSDEPRDLAISPDGSLLFVTGRSVGADGEEDFATVAYDATTGATRWVARLDNPSESFIDGPEGVRVGPDGSTIYVAGGFANPGGVGTWTTLAYDAATGRRRWVSDLPLAYAVPRSLALGPDGSVLYVTGTVGAGASDVASVAYDSATGARLTTVRYPGPAGSQDTAIDVAVGLDGAVFVLASSDVHYATIAYEPLLASRRWVARYQGPGQQNDGPFALAVSPDGTRVSVTGYSQGPTGSSDYGTVTYDAAIGRELWVARYGRDDTEDVGYDLGYSPDGSLLYVTGASDGDFATVQLDAMTGQALWVDRRDGPGHESDAAVAIVVGPDGGRFFVTGWVHETFGEPSHTDYGTVGYRAPGAGDGRGSA